MQAKDGSCLLDCTQDIVIMSSRLRPVCMQCHATELAAEPSNAYTCLIARLCVSVYLCVCVAYRLIHIFARNDAFIAPKYFRKLQANQLPVHCTWLVSALAFVCAVPAAYSATVSAPSIMNTHTHTHTHTHMLSAPSIMNTYTQLHGQADKEKQPLCEAAALGVMMIQCTIDIPCWFSYVCACVCMCAGVCMCVQWNATLDSASVMLLASGFSIPFALVVVGRGMDGRVKGTHTHTHTHTHTDRYTQMHTHTHAHAHGQTGGLGIQGKCASCLQCSHGALTYKKYRHVGRAHGATRSPMCVLTARVLRRALL